MKSALLVLCTALPAFAGDFEMLFSPSGHVRSFAYFSQGSDNFIDTFVGVESELLRYKSTYAVFEFENETDMGRGAQPGMPFDPNRGRWTFAFESRTELSRNFFEVQLRHDCYHGIDRYWPGEDYKMTAAGVAFGSRTFLQKYRYKDYSESAESLQFPLLFDYYVAPSVYVPPGSFWQRTPYVGRMEVNLRLDLLRWSRIGLGFESLNVLYLTNTNDIQRSHVLNLDVYLYGAGHALIAFMGYWPVDNQRLRNRSGRVVAGLELSL